MDYGPDDLPSRPPPLAHRAPPPDVRPRSRLATWALILSIALWLPALFGGLWILMVPGVLLSVWALVRVKPAVQKGHGLALVALLVSLAGGSCSYMTGVALRDSVGRMGRGALAALASENEPQRLEDWFTKKAVADGVLDRVRRRFAAAVEVYGPYAGELVEASPLQGGLPFMPPSAGTVREIGEAEGGDPVREGHPLWARARFERGVLRLELLITQDGFEALQRVQMGQGQDEPPEVLEDLRFYADK